MIKKEAKTNIFDTYSDTELSLLIDALHELHHERKNARKELHLPLSLFANRKLGVLETVVKCLKENYAMSLAEIATLLNRNHRTVWTAYDSATKKFDKQFFLEQEYHVLPVSIFSERELAPLQALVAHLRDHQKLRFTDISSHLNRNYRTIWHSYQKAIEKRGLNEDI